MKQGSEFRAQGGRGNPLFQITRVLLTSRIFRQRGLTPEISEIRDVIYDLKPSFRGLELELDLSANDVMTMGIVKMCCTVGPKL